MNTIAKYTRTTYEINKSTFITTLKPVQNVNEAKAFFEEIKKEFSDATHNITVYIIGKTGEAGHYSDDGEPSGTAGLPVLEVFRKNDITNFACVVTRYFDYIEDLIERENVFTMEEFSKSVNEFLAFRRYDILKDNWRISHKQAVEKAYQEYDIFNKTQPIESDFDKIVKGLEKKE